MKGLSRCELCGYEFQFSNVFAPDAPVSVRAFELVRMFCAMCCACALRPLIADIDIECGA